MACPHGSRSPFAVAPAGQQPSAGAGRDVSRSRLRLSRVGTASWNCRFVEIEPKRKLRYSWSVGDLDTVVTFALAPTATGTRLSLQQSGFTPQQKKNFGGARYGWRLMGGRLAAVLASAP